MNCLKCWIEFTPEKEWHLHCKDCYEFFITSQPRDYTLLVNIDTPKEIRRKFDIGDIYINQIQCNKCWQVIRSKNRHNFVQCKCKTCAVDWWSWYWRMIWNIGDYDDLSIYFTDNDSSSKY